MEPLSNFCTGASGLGIYGQTIGPREQAAIEFVKDRILAAVDTIPVNNKQDAVFTMADFGTADGCTSMPLIKDIIKRIRQSHGEIPIQVVYEDQASNDFNSLFKRVHGIIMDPHHYLSDFKRVYVMATGTGFYEQTLPDRSVNFSMSFNSAHYLSKPATKFQNSLDRFPNGTESERKLLEAQSAEDIEIFFLQRARELKPGGLVVVSMPAEDPDMKNDGVRLSFQGLEEGLLKIWQQMRDEGKITREEFVDSNFYRNIPYLKEMTAPFEDPESAVSKAGLRLVHAETVLIPCILKQQWQRKLDQEGVDDRSGWAKAVVHQNRCWTVHVFIRGLSSTRSKHEREALVDELYDRLEGEMFAQGPKAFKNDNLLNYVFARKV